jgi:hypothetical protein
LAREFAPDDKLSILKKFSLGSNSFAKEYKNGFLYAESFLFNYNLNFLKEFFHANGFTTTKPLEAVYNLVRKHIQVIIFFLSLICLYF